ncbi:MAG: WG repeat-containing protein [Bacteroidaceae bacterium]|nr:WG repeat-containing protein [Bacteroidaceae bacterium]
MNSRFYPFILGIFIALLCACGNNESAYQPQTGYLLVFADDSCHCITYGDEPVFSQQFTNISLYYSDLAAAQTPEGLWGFVNRKGEVCLPAVYDKTTVFSEGLAWVMKRGNMPSAINDRGDVKISLRDICNVRVYHEGHAAYCMTKKGVHLWGFLDKNGNEKIKAQYRDVRDFRLGLSAVQDNATGLWGYINLKGEVVIPYRYQEAYPFHDNGMALVKDEKQYRLINRKGDEMQQLAFDKAMPDNEWIMVRSEQGWGWCNEKGTIAIATQFEEVRPFGNADLAPVKIRGKWGYVNRSGKVVIKRQFTEAYPFVDGCAAVKTGTVWGFINDKGTFVVNPQYEFMSQDYLYQSLGYGSSFSTLQIE